MELKEMIGKRKSVRSYTDQPVDRETLDKIRAFSAALKPLYPDIRVRSEIVGKERVKCILPWTTPQLIAVFSEEKEGYLENVGFLYQQLDLYLQSIGLGVCWLGMGRMDQQKSVDTKDDGLKFVILLAFGYPRGSALRSDAREFKRKPLAQIADREDARLEPARLAPSSVNSQPWYFTHEGDGIHVYCVRQGILKNKDMGNMNRMDIGIALAHLYISNPDTFRFFKAETAAPVAGYGYLGSVCL